MMLEQRVVQESYHQFGRQIPVAGPSVDAPREAFATLHVNVVDGPLPWYNVLNLSGSTTQNLCCSMAYTSVAIGTILSFNGCA